MGFFFAKKFLGADGLLWDNFEKFGRIFPRKNSIFFWRLVFEEM